MPALPLAAGLTHVCNVLREAGNRIVGLPEVAGTLIGSRRPKNLRLRVAILRDEHGRPVAAPADVEPSLREARRVLREQLAIEILPAGEPLVTTLQAPAPREALDVACAERSYRAELGTAGAFFRRHAARGPASGSGAPITVFVVRDVLGKAGCSLGPLVDYVTVDMTALKGHAKRVLVHELGHACGLPHASAAGNLMRPKRMGERLNAPQAAVFRSSRHVTYR